MNNNTNQNQIQSNHESDSAASTIQRWYRRHSATGASSLTLMPEDFGSVTIVAMTYDSSNEADVTETMEHQDDEHEHDDSTTYGGREGAQEKSLLGSCSNCRDV